MSAWAYLCRAREDSSQRWFVSRSAVLEFPPQTVGVLVRVGDDWLPAVVDRSQQHSVEALLIRDVIVDENYSGLHHAGPGAESPSVSWMTPEALNRGGTIPHPEPDTQRQATSGRVVTAAAVSLAGAKFVVVLVALSTVLGPGESDLVVADLEPRFGVPVVLMGQEEDGTPVYYGEDRLKELLATVPVDRMPWKEYTV